MGAYPAKWIWPVGRSNAQPLLAASDAILRSLQQLAELHLQVIKTSIVDNQAFADRLSRSDEGGDQFALYAESATRMRAKLTAYGDQLRTIMGAAGDPIRETPQSSMGSTRYLARSEVLGPKRAPTKPRRSPKQ